MSNYTKEQVIKAKSHFKYGIDCDIFSEPVLTYAKIALEAIEYYFELDNQEVEKQDEVNRARIMRERISEIVEEQEAEIERLTAGYNDLLEQFRILDFECSRLERRDKMHDEIKSEAIKEYKHRVENDIISLLGKSNCNDFLECLDYRYKEMVGE